MFCSSRSRAASGQARRARTALAISRPLMSQTPDTSVKCMHFQVVPALLPARRVARPQRLHFAAAAVPDPRHECNTSRPQCAQTPDTSVNCLFFQLVCAGAPRTLPLLSGGRPGGPRYTPPPPGGAPGGRVHSPSSRGGPPGAPRTLPFLPAGPPGSGGLPEGPPYTSPPPGGPPGGPPYTPPLPGGPPGRPPVHSPSSRGGPRGPPVHSPSSRGPNTHSKNTVRNAGVCPPGGPPVHSPQPAGGPPGSGGPPRGPPVHSPSSRGAPLQGRIDHMQHDRTRPPQANMIIQDTPPQPIYHQQK